MQPKLRHGLRAELGAFYPLFVLRPLEQGTRAQQQQQAAQQKHAQHRQGTGTETVPESAHSPPPAPTPSPTDPIASEQTDLHTLYVVLGSLRSLCGDPQMVADLFVNYDCDPQAPPLFEHTVQVRMYA